MIECVLNYTKVYLSTHSYHIFVCIVLLPVLGMLIRCVPLHFSVVEHTLYHISLCIVLLPVLGMLIRCVPLQFSVVEHTLYHISLCIVLLPILGMMIRCVPLCHQIVYSLYLLYFSVCNICAVRYLVCNARSCAAIVSLSVSPFNSPLDRRRNVSSSPISCLSILLIH